MDCLRVASAVDARPDLGEVGRKTSAVGRRRLRFVFFHRYGLPSGIGDEGRHLAKEVDIRTWIWLRSLQGKAGHLA